VNQVEINFIIGCDLDSDITFDVVNETSLLNDFVLSPDLDTGLFIYLSSKEKNITGASGNESTIVN